MEFLAQGVHLKVPNAGRDFARGHFKIGIPLSQVHAIDYTWYGTDNKPGVYYDIDIDGDGNVDGELIGESFYGATTCGSTRTPRTCRATHTQPDGTFASAGAVRQRHAAPGCDRHLYAAQRRRCTVPRHHRRLEPSHHAGGKTADIVAGGFVASGLQQDGVLTQITYGPDQFVFTNHAKAKVDGRPPRPSATR